MNTAKIEDRLADLEAKSHEGEGAAMAESIVKQLTDEEKQVLVSEYVRSAYGPIPGWDFSTIDVDYSRVSARIAALKEAASNGRKDF